MQSGNIYALAMTISLALSTGAAAATMSKDQYQSARRGLAAELDSSRATCRSLSGNAIELCKAEANRQHKVETATLEANYQPSRDGSYKARVAIADADYLVARRKCDAKAAHIKDLCLKEARAVQIAAKADASALEDTSIVARADNDKVDAARKALREAEERTETRKDMATEKRNTNLQISKEKCEMLAEDAKIACVKESKKRFGQS